MIVRDQCGLCFDNGHVVRLRREELHWRGMADKMAQSGIGNADDMEKKICYTYIVYKWVLRNLLVFIFRKGVRYYEILSILRQRTCKSGSIFCTECGESLSSAVPEEAPVTEAQREKKRAARSM